MRLPRAWAVRPSACQYLLSYPVETVGDEWRAAFGLINDKRNAYGDSYSCWSKRVIIVYGVTGLITEQEVRVLKQKLMEGKTQETASAKAGISVRSARECQSGPLPSETKLGHGWRTRPDPFAGVWDHEIEPLLRNFPRGVPQE